jgi:cyclopropane fatty-acyl-phospholipid synthase-like methyltransferase
MTTQIKVHDNWYESFFQGINCELWEKAVSPEWNKAEADFLFHHLNMKPGQHLLDIPCGNGRLSLELSKKKLQVTAVDLSETFLASLNHKIQSEQLPIRTIHADMLSVHLEGRYSGAICMGNSFGYFNAVKMDLFIEKISAALETGSRFLINSGMVAESILPNFSKNKSYTIGDIQMDITNTYEVTDSYMVSTILYTKGGKTETHSFKHYVFTLAEVKRMLQKQGLETKAAYGSVSEAVYKLGDPQIYLVAEKQ